MTGAGPTEALPKKRYLFTTGTCGETSTMSVVKYTVSCGTVWCVMAVARNLSYFPNTAV